MGESRLHMASRLTQGHDVGLGLEIGQGRGPKEKSQTKRPCSQNGWLYRNQRIWGKESKTLGLERLRMRCGSLDDSVTGTCEYGLRETGSQSLRWCVN